MRRMVIIGATGSGKTTLAGKISAALGHDFIDLDELHWLPEWKERDVGEFTKLVAAATAREAWVSSGNYRAVRDIVWSRADTVVWLDYPPYLVFWRLLCRSLRRIRDKALVCNGNRETLLKFLSKDSIMVWLFKSYWRRKHEFTIIFDNQWQYPHISFIHLTTPEETEKWLTQISSHP